MYLFLLLFLRRILGIIRKMNHEGGKLELVTSVEGEISQMWFGSPKVNSTDEDLIQRM